MGSSVTTGHNAPDKSSEVPATGEHVKRSGDQNICELLILIKSNSSKTLCILKTAKNKRCTLNTQGVSRGGEGVTIGALAQGVRRGPHTTAEPEAGTARAREPPAGSAACSPRPRG